MINSIQSYQNSPRLTNKQKNVANSPNFGTNLTYTLSDKATEKLIHLKKCSRDKGLLGFFSRLRDYLDEATKLLKQDGNNTTEAKLHIYDIIEKPIDFEGPGIAGKLAIGETKPTIWVFNPVTNQISMVTDILITGKTQRSEIAKADNQAVRELLKHAVGK